jgi:predicted metal-dependent hydrolase
MQRRVIYALKRSSRRSIGFTISVEGLRVSAPKWLGDHAIDAALQSKAAWIVRKLHEQHERLQRAGPSKFEWCDGASIPFLGQTLLIMLNPNLAATHSELNTPQPTLHLKLPQNTASQQICEATQRWLQQHVLHIFQARCEHFGRQLQVHIKRLSLSAAKTRWGSASANGSIRLNWRLVHHSLACIDYVVVHELAHLREMNHSPRFWAVVRSVLPDYEQSMRSLKNGLRPLCD